MGLEQRETDLKEVTGIIDSRCVKRAPVSNGMITWRMKRDALFHIAYVHESFFFFLYFV